jgi:hypothetical protein
VATPGCRRRWLVDGTYSEVAGVWRYVDRAIDQPGEIVNVYVSTMRDGRQPPESSRTPPLLTANRLKYHRQGARLAVPVRDVMPGCMA